MALLILSRASKATHGQLTHTSHRALTSLSSSHRIIPSFTGGSRRFDHALAPQKLKHHETNGPEGDTPSGPLGDNLRPEFSTVRTKISSDTLRAITQKPFTHVHMSSVQAAVLPLLPELARPHNRDESHGPPRDLLVKAKTGTGKTLAFLVPAIEARIRAVDKAGLDALEENGGRPDARVVENAKRVYAKKTVGAVVISPTRELATQIAKEAIKLTHWHKGFEVKVFTGGSSKGLQLREFEHGRNDIVVATPGRLRDVLENHPNAAEVLKTATQLVLDEADTLLDMGFRADIDAIVNFFPETPIRQTFLFSATVSPAIRQVARDVLDPDHVFIDVVPKDESPVHAHIPQHFTVLPSASEQIPHLVRLIAHDQLANPGNSKVMVFLNTTKQTQLFSTLLHELSTTTLPARSQLYEIHSKRTQAARTSASNAFRRDRSGAAILVTSDVSARGVDYPGVTRVIQVGIPASTEQYVHRVGRTGRAGKGGRADLVLLPFEQKFVRYQLSDVPIEELSHGTLLNQTTALAGKFESDPAAFFESSKEAESRPNDVTIKARRFRDKPNTVLGSLNTQVTGLIDQVDPDAIREVFVSLLGYYLPKAGDMHISRNSAYEELQKWTTEACGLPKPPFISEELLAKMGGVYGSSSRHSMERRPSRTNFGFKSPATRYINSERNRWQNDRTDREFARGPRWGGDENASSGSRWSGRGSRSSHGDSERRTFSRSERARDDRQNRWL